MNKIGVIVLISALVAGNLVAAKENPTVVCTTTALQALVETVGGDRLDVVSLVQPGVCPSHFDVRPSHVSEVEQASLVLYHGVEPWLEGLVEAAGSESLQTVKVTGPWNTPEMASQKIVMIRDALTQIDPDNASYYTENAQRAVSELETLADSIKEEAESLDTGNVSVLCMEWQQYIVEWMGFSIAGTYSPPETLSVKDVNQLIKTGEKAGAILVIDNLQSGTDIGSRIASEIGAYHVILTNFPHAVPETDTLADMIEYNARQLLTAVQEYQEEKQTISTLEKELEKERSRRDIYQVLTFVLAVLCGIESLVLYVRTR
ncbi:MAG: zinc ABC transporter substrate-binding protein [Theionarchaea archaeon]|nr:zinc ABC transporter substrate-binding protein [Theionarchaea archaeon]MBU7000229.1 zinc ABC transporter substrate-binding protein [Theionarchaea archaeon]MBU7022126.1 zinc ABC transporter substrate-binding protein [Theionarchaea archaeon]